MDYHNIFAREQLMKVAVEVNKEIDDLQAPSKEWGNLDLELARGIRGGLKIARDKIYKQVEQLQSDYKQK